MQHSKLGGLSREFLYDQTTSMVHNFRRWSLTVLRSLPLREFQIHKKPMLTVWLIICHVRSEPLRNVMITISHGGVEWWLKERAHLEIC